MLSNNKFLETRIQRLLDGLFFNKKGLGVHVQHMLNLSRIYTLAEILSIFFVIKRRKIGELIYDHRLQFNYFVPTFFLLKHCLHDLHLCIQKMLTNREMVNCHKWDIFRFSL